MRGAAGALRVALVISIGLGRLVATALRGIKGLLTPSSTSARSIIAKEYSNAAAFQAEARELIGKGYTISSIAGLPGHADLMRAAVDGNLSDLVYAAMGSRTSDKIVVVYGRRDA